MATPTSATATTETSVMMSLRELRAIEDTRREDEILARERAIVEAARRREAEVAAAAAHAAALIAAREDEERRAAAAREAAAREVEIRLREAEIHARADADALLAATRLDQEMELRRQQIARTRPRTMYVLLAAFAAAAIGLGVLGVDRAQRTDELDQALAQARAEQLTQTARTAAAQTALRGNQQVIAGLRTQLHALAVALAHAGPTVIRGGGGGPRPPRGTPGATGVTPAPAGARPTIDLGDCARQPLLCEK
jgi:hypothetical protein